MLTRAYGISTATRRALGIGLVQMGVTHLGEDLPKQACVHVQTNATLETISYVKAVETVLASIGVHIEDGANGP